MQLLNVVALDHFKRNHANAVAHLLKLMATGSDVHNQTIELLAVLIQDYERKVSEVLNRKRPLTLAMIRRLQQLKDRPDNLEGTAGNS